jgi:hypothetical protein
VLFLRAQDTAMHAPISIPSGQNTRRSGPDHRWLEALVNAIDDRLRERHGVIEFTRAPDCIFRIQLARSPFDLVLADGTRVRPGDRVINLHLWNEQIPLFPEQGPTLGWARRMSCAFDVSLRELGLYLATHRDLDDVMAICANLSLATGEQRAQITRIVGRRGFEPIALRDSPSLSERVRRFGENVLISMMVLARNAAALRADSLWRDRTLVFLSRPKLERRYGARRTRAARIEETEGAVRSAGLFMK